MKYLVLFLIGTTNLLIGQNNHQYENNDVIGIATSQNGTYLILNSGYLRLSGHDAYTEYYRTIYNDSTLANPNTIISDKYSLELIPYILPSAEGDKNIFFEEPLKFGIFLRLNENDQFELTDFASSVIDSLLVK